MMLPIAALGFGLVAAALGAPGLGLPSVVSFTVAPDLSAAYVTLDDFVGSRSRPMVSARRWAATIALEIVGSMRPVGPVMASRARGLAVRRHDPAA